MKNLLILIVVFGFALPFSTAQLPLILVQPSVNPVCPEDTAKIHMSVSPIVDSIQWQYFNLPTGMWTDIPVNGFSIMNETILLVFEPTEYKNKYFRALIRDTSGILLISPIPSDSVILNVYDSLSAAINPHDTSICMGSSVTLHAPSGNPAYMYMWSPPGHGILDSIVVFEKGTYSVTVTNTNGCTGTSSATVNFHNPTTPIVFDPPDPQICTMGATTTVLRTQSQYNKYFWSTQGQQGNLDSITVSHTGQVYLTVTDPNGCTANSSVPVANYETPILDITSPGFEFCHGDSTSLNATVDPDYDYLWSTNEMDSSIIVKKAGNYWVSVKDQYGCVASSAKDVTVHNNPISKFIMTTFPANFIKATQQILFKDTSTMADAALMKWKWDFGPNNLLPDTISYYLPEKSAIVSYSVSGSKKVCLEVKDYNTCIDDSCINFTVYPLDGPLVDLSETFRAKCIVDSTKLSVRIKNLDPIIYKLLDTIRWDFDPPISKARYKLYKSPFDVNDWVVEARINFPDTGKYFVKVTGYWGKLIGIDTSSSIDTMTVTAGSYVPEIDHYYVPQFICRDDIAEIELYLNPSQDATIIYNINNEPINNQGVATGGYIKIIIPSSQIGNQIRFKVLSIESKNGCENPNPGLDTFIEIRKRPTLTFDYPGVVCVGSNKSLIVHGANKFEWRLGGIIVSTDTLLPIHSLIAGQLIYSVTGTTMQCSTTQNDTVDIIDLPTPSITGNSSACLGQVVSDTSNLNTGNTWEATGGIILGSNTDKIVAVQWNSSGSLKLIQQKGGCTDSTSIPINVSGNSPPYNKLVYLTGGGILLYPNPTGEQDLCYEWYKDGLVQPGEIYQGFVIQPNLSEIELKRYSVKVYYCGQGTGCAQLITRFIEEVSIPTAFHLLAVPNPTSGNFYLQYKIPDTGNYIQYLFDCSGRVLHKETIALEDHTGIINMSLSNMASGIYFVKLINTATGEFQVVSVSIIF